MTDYEIFSDGACDLPLDQVEKLGAHTIPFYVSLNQKDYHKELVDLSSEAFYEDLVEKNGFPKTSLPSVQDYIDAFKPVLEAGKNLICLTITHTLSGSIQSAANAAMILSEQFPHAKIYAMDSFHATGSQQLMLLEALRMKQAGKTFDQVVKYLEQAKNDGRIFFMIQSLTHLQKGGRIGKLASLSTSILKIKPLIALSGGEISVAGIAHTRKGGIKKLAEITADHFQKTKEKPQDYRFLIGTTNTWDEVPVLEEAICNAVPDIQEISSFQIGATIASHTGPGTLGVCCMKRFEAYE